jgi:2-amino-4-ketopentanoate thiolase alpha subunit
MAEPVPAGTWVVLHRVVLPAGERAPQVPPETQAVPLELRVSGWLAEPAALGEPAVVRTAAGRMLQGTLVAVDPVYAHGFGAPVPELQPVGGELRALLERDDTE